MNTYRLAFSRMKVNMLSNGEKFGYLSLFLVYIFCGSVLAVDNFELAIIHTNDVYSRYEQTDKNGGDCSVSDAELGQCFAGVARMSTKIKELRQSGKNTILLNAGDQFHGKLWFRYYKGSTAATFMNELQYDAMALGNHEFDQGIDVLASFADNVTFPLLSCNLNISKEPRLQGKILKTTTLDVSGQKVGIIGYTTPRTMEISNPGPTVNFEDIITEVRKEAEALTTSGVNKIIALGHWGYQYDLQLAREVSNIDIVIGGHSTTFLYSGPSPPDKPSGPYPTIVKNKDGDNVTVVTAYRFGKYLGYIVLEFDNSGKVVSWEGAPILLDNSTAQDPEVLAKVEELAKPMNEFTEREIGSSLVYMEGRGYYCRIGECNVGNLFTDALVWYHQPKTPMNSGWTDAAIALVNSGGLQGSIRKGPITMGEVMIALPYGNTYDIISIKGEHLLQVLEYGASRIRYEVPRYGGFFQMSGMRVEYDMNKPVGSRVVSVLVLCARCDMPVYSPLNKTERYRVITTSFIINGGDGYKVLKDNYISRDGRDDLDATVLQAYVKKFSPLVTSLDGRIKFVEEKAKCEVNSADRQVDYTYRITTMAFLTTFLIAYFL